MRPGELSGTGTGRRMTATAVENVTGHLVCLERERELRRAHFAPPPRLTVSEWADRFRVLTSEGSATIGQWTTIPFQRDVMDALHKPGVVRVVAMMPAQVAGKTEVLLNIIGYHVDLEPCPILLVEPNIEMCNDISKERLAPMFRNSPRLRGLLHESGRRETNNTLRHKAGPGWHITLVGSNSPAGLSSRPIRIVLADEVDRYEASAKDEGDPVKLAEARTTTFMDSRVTYMTSTPTVKTISRIEDEYAKSDMGKWFVPCPHCGHMQTLEWGGPSEAFGIKWDRDADGTHHPETAEYLCVSCGTLIEESEKGEMNDAGEWRHSKNVPHIVGFQMTCLPSPFILWSTVVQEFLEAKNRPEQLQTWVNTRLAETWEAAGESLDAKTLAARREKWPGELPHGVEVLTAGVDVQHDRLEMVLWGWGAGEESWIVANYRIMGAPDRYDVWKELEAWRTQTWEHPASGSMRIRIMCVDAGHLPAMVHDYCRQKWKARVFATVGVSKYGRTIIQKPTKSDRFKTRLWTVGTDQAKDVLFARLNRIQRPGPGYIHVGNEVDDRFLEQFEAERAVKVQRGGRWVRTYKQVGQRPNEAIDLAVMNIAGLHILGPVVRGRLRKAKVEVEPEPEALAEPEAPAEPAMVAEPTKRRLRGIRGKRKWVSGWK